MLKRISCLALSSVLLLGVFVQQVTALEDPVVTEQQAVSAEEVTVLEQEADTAEDSINSEQQADVTEEIPVQEEPVDVPTGPSIMADGIVIENASPSLYEQTTYVSLRNVTLALCPDAVITWAGDHASVTAEGLTMAIYPSKSYLVANGRYLYLPYGVRVDSGSIMLPVRTLAQALGAKVQWDAATGNINICSGTGAIVSGDEYYDADSLYWLSRIINAESGNQPLTGKIGVGNVILNRVSSSLFPNTIYDVIFQKNQFSPAYNGSIKKTPNAESILAAKLCLDGAVVLPNALWFNRAGMNCWASRNKSYVATIGAHSFYA